MNIGKVIRDSTRRSRRCTTTGGFRHPCLITELCRRPGVEIGRREKRVSPKGAICRTTISAFQGHGEEERGDEEHRAKEAHGEDHQDHLEVEVREKSLGEHALRMAEEALRVI